MVDIVDGPDGLGHAIRRRAAVVPGGVTDTLDISIKPEAARPGYWLVLGADAQPLGHADDREELASLVTDLYHEALFDHCLGRQPPLLVVHAGVVAVDGQAILIPGTSGSGKSTLVSALVEAGASYLSDEYAILGEDGLVRPYPRPIALRTSGPDQRPTPAAAPPRTTSYEPVQVAVIVDTTYEPGQTWKPELVRRAAAVLPLLAQGAGVREQPALTLRIAGALATASLLRGPRGDASETAELLMATVQATGAVAATGGAEAP